MEIGDPCRNGQIEKREEGVLKGANRCVRRPSNGGRAIALGEQKVGEEGLIILEKKGISSTYSIVQRPQTAALDWERA